MIQQFEKTVEVSGKGAGRQQAVVSALGRIQSAVRAEKNQTLLRIVPEDVKVVEAVEVKRTERFLFFFLPRERRRCHVRLEVRVSVMVIDVDAIPFSTQ